MKFLTDFGDSAVLLPVSIAILVWLLASGTVRGGIWWTVAMAFCGAAIGILKIVFYACPPAPNLGSPSGHTALSLLVYGALAAIVALEVRTRWLRWTVVLAALLFILAIAQSRLELRLHTRPEIVAGLAVGAAALAVFVVNYWRTPRSFRRTAPLSVAAIATIALFHGCQLTPEGKLHDVSKLLNIRDLICR